MKPLILSFMLLTLLTNCSEKMIEVEEIIDPLQDSEFILTVDRVVYSPEVQFPATELQESHYSTFAEEREYIVIFSENGQQVTITPNAFSDLADPMIGIKEQSISDKAYFNITSGTFAGGRFVIWAKDKKLQCELTIYGSGVPIIRSERGLLSVPH